MSGNDSTRTTASTALSGWSVLVTRPREQAESLCHLIEDSGGTAVRFPVIEILPGRDKQRMQDLIDAHEQYDIAIFISANAVQHALDAWPDHRDRPQGLHIAAIGRATLAALEQYGWDADLVPDSVFNSEALLALPELQDVSGKRIMIIRGEGGRELLGDTLCSRGAQVEYAEVYRRVLPKPNVNEKLQPWLQAQNSAVVVTSQQGLDNLVTLLGSEGVKQLMHTPMVVISERIVEKTRAYGIQAPVIIARQASDEAILVALIELSRQQQSLGQQ